MGHLSLEVQTRDLLLPAGPPPRIDFGPASLNREIEPTRSTTGATSFGIEFRPRARQTHHSSRASFHTSHTPRPTLLCPDHPPFSPRATLLANARPCLSPERSSPPARPSHALSASPSANAAARTPRPPFAVRRRRPRALRPPNGIEGERPVYSPLSPRSRSSPSPPSPPSPLWLLLRPSSNRQGTKSSLAPGLTRRPVSCFVFLGLEGITYDPTARGMLESAPMADSTLRSHLGTAAMGCVRGAVANEGTGCNGRLVATLSDGISACAGREPRP